MLTRDTPAASDAPRGRVSTGTGGRRRSPPARDISQSVPTVTPRPARVFQSMALTAAPLRQRAVHAPFGPGTGALAKGSTSGGPKPSMIAARIDGSLIIGHCRRDEGVRRSSQLAIALAAGRTVKFRL